MRIIAIRFEDLDESQVNDIRWDIEQLLNEKIGSYAYRIASGLEDDPLDFGGDSEKPGDRQMWFFKKMLGDLSAFYYKTEKIIPDHPHLSQAKTVLQVAVEETETMDKMRCSQLIDAMKEVLGELRT